MKQIYTTTLRLNLENEADRRAWEHLQSLDRREYRSVSKAVVSAVNAYFDRSKQLADDPYLETREKEDAFLSPDRGYHLTQLAELYAGKPWRYPTAYAERTACRCSCFGGNRGGHFSCAGFCRRLLKLLFLILLLCWWQYNPSLLPNWQFSE